VAWGEKNDVYQFANMPASLADVALTEVAPTAGAMLALTGEGKVVGWGKNDSRLHLIPDRIKALDVVDLAAGQAYAGVVTREGTVAMWGPAQTGFGDPTDVPAGLTGVTQLAVGQENALALKSDGTVVAWGRDQFGVNSVPAGLHATQVTISHGVAYALTTNKTVVAWGDPSQGALVLPSDVTQAPGHVVAVSALIVGGLALMDDGRIVGWGGSADDPSEIPTTAGKSAVALSASAEDSLGLDEDGVLHAAGPGAALYMTPPAGLSALPVSQFAITAHFAGAIVTKMLKAAPPVVSGTPRVGSTLTASPGTFSGSPDAVAGQWLANGTPISGSTGTSLALGSNLAGKTISYSSTATKAGSTTMTSTSAATAAVAAATPPATTKVGSSSRITKVTVAKKGTKVAVTGKVTASKAPTGTARLVFTKGKKVIVSKTVKVAKNGTLALTVKQFGKLAIKKTAIKKKGKTKKGTYWGKYKVTLTYAGNASVKPSKASKSFAIKK
jgi:hypothetical protein